MSASDHLADLADFVAASPSSFHAAAEGARRLAAAGFTEQAEAAEWDPSPGGHYLIRDGSLVAWRVPGDAGPTTPYRIIGAHTDSPGFVVKPRPDVRGFGWQQVAVEVYGGPLLNSWLDRELGLAGRVVGADGTSTLVRTGPVMRIPQLAIHLDRAANDGLTLDRQQHLLPVLSVGRPDLSVLGLFDGVDPAEVAGADLVAFDTARGAVFGPTGEFFACGRLDNLSHVHAGLTALTVAEATPFIPVLAAFDHEEIGSASRSGAAGPLLADVLARITSGLGGGVEERARALAGSVCLSADTGHALHPNYAGRHDPTHQPMLNGGPLLKVNANQRYATDAVGAALWRRCCRAAGVGMQEFVSHNAVPCGSTIGPLTAARLGIRTVDVGIPLLSMHSAREMAGAEDPYAITLAMGEFLGAE